MTWTWHQSCTIETQSYAVLNFSVLPNTSSDFNTSPLNGTWLWAIDESFCLKAYAHWSCVCVYLSVWACVSAPEYLWEGEVWAGRESARRPQSVPGPRALPRSRPAAAAHSSLRTRSPAPCTHLSSIGGGHDQLVSAQSLRHTFCFEGLLRWCFLGTICWWQVKLHSADLQIWFDTSCWIAVITRRPSNDVRQVSTCNITSIHYASRWTAWCWKAAVIPTWLRSGDSGKEVPSPDCLSSGLPFSSTWIPKAQ